MSEAQDPSVTEVSNEPVAQVRAADSDDPAVLRQKLELVQHDSRTQGETNKALKKELEDMRRTVAELQSSQQKAKQAKLAESGEYQALWKEATGTVSSLQDELAARDKTIDEMKVQFQQQQIKANATNLFAQSGVNAPEHLMKILGDNLRLDENGAVVCLAGGVQVPLNQHIDSLKQPGSGFEMFFSPSAARGMGASGSSSVSTGGKDLSSMTLTERCRLEIESLSCTPNWLRSRGAADYF